MKRNNTTSVITLCFLLLLCSSCEEIIDFNGKQAQSKVVMNCHVEPGGKVEIVLSPSKFIFGEKDDSEHSYWTPGDIENINEIDKADITLTINDHNVRPERITAGYYEYQADAFQPGDKLAIHAEVGYFGTVTAEEVFPHAPQILSLDTIRFFDKDEYTLYMRALIKIKDTPGEKNYYRLLLNRYVIYEFEGKEELGPRYTYFAIDQDIAMSSLTNEGIVDEDSNMFHIFPDDLFNGKEYTINIYFPLAQGSYLLKEKTLMQFELQSLTESYYLYMRTLEQSYNSDVFSQPVRIYSNVENGYGILGLYNSTFYDIYVMPDGED